MSRLKANFKGGTVLDSPLTDVATSFASAELTDCPVVDGGNILVVVFDPDSFAPEIAHITAHGDSANTATILRGQEGTMAREHIFTTTWIHAPTAADYGGAVNDRAWAPPTFHTLDDEFNDGILDPAWVQYNNGTAVMTYTEAGDVLSIKHGGGGTDNAGPAHCLLKPIGSVTPPVSFEAAFRFFRRRIINYQMFGLILTTGTTAASASTWMMPFSQTATPGGWTFSVRSHAALNAGEIANHGDQDWEMMGGPLYQRLTWVSTNTFRAEWSPDGVSWHKQPTADFARTMTPTHVGFAMSTWTVTTIPGMIGTVEYLRVT